MRSLNAASAAALSILSALASPAAIRVTVPDVTVGLHLQAPVNLTLAEPANGAVAVKVTSSDPARLLLSTAPERAGTASVTLMVQAGSRFTPEFFVQGMAASGAAAYTASAPGFEDGTGTVTLAPSGLVFARAGIPLSELRTTTGVKSALTVCPALLDASSNYIGLQAVAGGLSIQAEVRSSDEKVGSAAERRVAFEGGGLAAAVEFQPAAPGTTTLSLAPPAGLRVPAQFAAVTALVILPGIAITEEAAVGQNLQVEAVLRLGEPAPAGGVAVTLTSADPERLLVAPSAHQQGSGSLVLRIPQGESGATYYLQGLGNSGTVETAASAPGYRTRTAPITLAPSGVVIGGPPGPPDEAELFRKDAADGPHGFLARFKPGATVPLLIYTVQLDPVTRRSADLTVQPLRAGVSLTALLRNGNPEVGNLRASSLTIEGGAHTATTDFMLLREGSAVISVATPKGFEKSANATELTVIVAK